MESKRKILLQAMGYSDKAIALLENNHHVGEIKNPTITATEKGTCGDVMFLYLLLENQIIMDAKFEFIGCAGLQSAGAGLIEIIKGKPVSKALKIRAQDIIDFLGGLPQTKYECATIAERTLHKALASCKIQINGSKF
jgi:NifU-like protein involved in Fe-S cluster formation